MKIIIRNFIDASVLGAVITLFSLFCMSHDKHFPLIPAVFYGFPLSYFRVVTLIGANINFLNAFLDFVFYFVIVFGAVSLLSLDFQKLGIRRRGVPTSPETEQKNTDRRNEEHPSLFFSGMREQNTVKVFRLLFVHNLAMTFLLVLGMTLSGTFWEILNGWIIFRNVLEVASWAYWVVGVVLIFLYARHLHSS